MSMNFLEEIDRLSKGVFAADPSSSRTLVDICHMADETFGAMSVEMKTQALSCFVSSFIKFSNRMSLFSSSDSIAVLHCSVTMLASFLTTQEPIPELHELVLYDNTAKLFSLMCKLVESTRQLPGNITLPLLTSKAYSFVGLPGYNLKMPEDVVTVYSSGSSAGSRSGKQGPPNKTRPGSGSVKKVRSLAVDPLLTNLEQLHLKSSPRSSETPSASSSPIDKEKSAAVRKNALHFLCLLLQNSSASFVMAVWPVLLDTQNSVTWRKGLDANHESWHILSLLLHDYSLVVRYMACSLVIELLDDGVKPFVTVAQDLNSMGVMSTSGASSSFTPYAVQLASQLREIHRCLIAAALHANRGHNKSPQMVVHVVKALQFLVRLTPYHRIRPGLLSDVFKVCASLLRSKDVDVRVACLSVFGEILANSHSHAMLEVECMVRSCKPPAFSRPLSVADSPTGSISGSETPLLAGEPAAFQPWLLKVSLESAAPNSVYSYPVKIEALQLLKSLIRFHAQTLFFEAKQLPELFRFVYTALYSSDAVYIAHVCYVLETIGNRLNDESTIDRLPLSELVLFWSDALSNHIFRLLQAVNTSATGQNATLKAALLDALASMGPLVFDRLPANLRILSTTTPLDLAAARDADKSLRAAAIRCLGHIVSFPSMIKDLQFVQSCVDLSLRHVALEPACQCAAAWLLRNALDSGVGGLPRDTQERVLNAGVSLIRKGPDKAKPHAMSVVWRILADSGLASRPDLALMVVDSVICPVLAGSVKGPVKLQWNDADGLLDFWSTPIGKSPLESHVPRLVECASTVLVNSPNFRTRTTLAKALTCLAARQPSWLLGKQCLRAFFEAFGTARQNIASPSEFKHVDPFITGLWLGVITWLATLEGEAQQVASWLASLSSESVENAEKNAKSAFLVVGGGAAAGVTGEVLDGAGQILSGLMESGVNNAATIKKVIDMLKDANVESKK